MLIHRFLGFWLTVLLGLHAFASPEDFLRLTELMYKSPAGGDFDFLELQNTSATESLDLSGVMITNAVVYQFPPGTTMAPEAVYLVAKTPGSAFRAEYGLPIGFPVFGPYSGKLSNGGERIRIVNGSKEIVDFTYNDGRGWPCEADGTGHSLIPTRFVSQRNGELDYGPNWKASAYIKGSPGTAEPAFNASLLINEIAANTELSNPAFPDHISNDWIELYNPTAAALPLSDLYLSDDSANLRKWALPAGTVPPTGQVSFDETTGFHNPLTTGFGLSRAGEPLYLSHLPASGPQRVLDCILYEAGPLNTTQGRFPDGDPYFQVLEPSRDAPNGPVAEGLLITEFMYHPPDTVVGTNVSDNTFAEFVEIHNPTTAPIPLSNALGPYELKGTVDYTFPIGAVVGPGEHIVVVSFDPSIPTQQSAFEATYNLAVSPTLFGPYTAVLPNSSGRIAITQPMPDSVATNPPVSAIIEQLIYTDGFPWDPLADGLGDSLHRVDEAVSASAPRNWSPAAPTPGNTPASLTNTPPSLALIPPQSTTVGTRLQLTALATDPDTGQTIHYQLVAPPDGALIDPTSGVFSWTPSLVGVYTTTVVATDDGVPPASNQQDVVFTVIGVNTPPVLHVPRIVYASPGTPVRFTATAIDPDLGQSLAFAAFAGPSGGSINPTTGQYTWTPGPGDLGTQTVNIAVADNGNPAGTDFEQVKIVVEDTLVPEITAIVPTTNPDGFTLAFTATPDTMYRLETATTLDHTGNWTSGPSVTPSATIGMIELQLLNPPSRLIFFRVVPIP